MATESQQLPLVMYRRGVRTEIGRAIVAADGHIEAQIAKDHWQLIKDLFMPNVGEISINPVPSKQVDLLISKIVPPTTPKIQEP